MGPQMQAAVRTGDKVPTAGKAMGGVQLLQVVETLVVAVPDIAERVADFVGSYGIC